jgi:hypothetical protein
MEGGTHKSQYVRWMLGKVRGDREDEHYDKPHGRDRSRNPEYAGWSPEDWDGKYKPFTATKVKMKNASAFIKAMKPVQSEARKAQMREFSRRWRGGAEHHAHLEGGYTPIRFKF